MVLSYSQGVTHYNKAQRGGDMVLSCSRGVNIQGVLGSPCLYRTVTFPPISNPMFKWVPSTMGKAVSRDEGHHPCGIDRAKLIQFDILL